MSRLGRAPTTPRRHWTAFFYTRANPLLRRVLVSRAHPLLSRRLLLLRITGRRTGRHYEICVGYHQPADNSILVLVSDAANRTWWRNLIERGPVEVVLRGETLAGSAVAHRPPSAEFKTAADRALPAIVGNAGARTYFAIAHLDPSRGLSQSDLESLAGFAVVVAIDLERQTGRGIAHPPAHG